MAQIINAPTSLGQRLGVGLGEGLQQLAQMKMQQLQQRQAQMRTAQGLEALQFTPEEAQQLSQLDPQSLGHVIKERVRAKGAQNQTSAGLQAIVPGLSQQESEAIGKLTPSLQAAWYRNIAGDLTAAQKDQGKQNQIELQPPTIPSEPKKEVKEKSITERALEVKAKKEAEKKLAQEEKELRKERHKEQLAADKETQKWYDATIRAKQAGKEGKLRLGRMEKLIEEGSLPFAATYNAIKSLGDSSVGSSIPIIGGLADLVLHTVGGIGSTIQHNITARDTAEFEKLSADFVKNAKDFFPSRVTNQDLAVFMQTVPTLMQTDRGKRAVIRNMRSFIELADARAQATEDIIADNGGHRPRDIASQVDSRTKQKEDEVYDQFINGITVS